MKKTLYFLLLTSLVGCVNTKKIQDPIPQHDSFELISNFVGEARVINVWLPPGYEESKTPFPVLYMPDGGSKEDFPHIANTIADLVDTKKKIRFWFAGSSAEDIAIHAHSLNKILKVNAPKTLTWEYLDQPKEKHNTIFRATKEQAFIWTMNK